MNQDVVGGKFEDYYICHPHPPQQYNNQPTNKQQKTKEYHSAF
jgi:hypothetical protein